MTIHNWLMLAVVFLVLEIVPPSTHFHFLCVALGALGAAVAGVFGPPWVSWLVFSVCSIALVPLLVPLADFLFAKRRQAAADSSETQPRGREHAGD